MPKAYVIACYRSVSDPAALAAYSELARPAIQAAGGRILAGGLPRYVREAGLKERTVLIEFDSFEQAVATYETEGYKKALEALGSTAERDIRIVEARE